jgi:hypothetical protein
MLKPRWHSAVDSDERSQDGVSNAESDFPAASESESASECAAALAAEAAGAVAAATN